MIYEVIAEGTVESCRKRESGYVVGIRTSPYCIEFYRTAYRRTIGAKIKIEHDSNFGFKFTEVTS